ncbi:Hypothetical protein HVPorG_04999 [Roseomonas mucosa]|uniref:HTH merR-type domain-containing protein n=1 Tax=Roseomonas mucosa TaxID=207340 RepID=A0A4Y1N0X2_9PROT|nr:hypothetical protein [Roseomonas mucosa]AWV23936.1 Hypothetical protein RADP37_04999 [Roseomonas mucosa]MDT8277595.1 hypothetical protein [Roseomonas mucosa]MDT8356401.1 hypothetical protein [Roseomonas mucosa]MDU7524641.1 hypothetical protein [Roseomonas mucosa]QDJ10881.1 Hypothetical protein HVPorG_04999 [Roseomonas mucosa]
MTQDIPGTPEVADYEPRYTTAQVSKATGIPQDTIKSWLSRKPQVILMTKEERENVGKGKPYLFSFSRTVHLLLTAKLVQMGLQPRQAAMGAAGFTDLGQGYTPDSDISKVRMPGQLYRDGYTVLVLHSGEEIGRVIQMDPRTTKLFDLFVDRGRHEDAIAILVNPLIERLRGALADE